MNFKKIQSTLFDHLSKEKVDSLSIEGILSQGESFNRQTFYKCYGSKSKFLGLCVSGVIRDSLRPYRDRSLQDNFYYLLHHIKQEQIFYTNVFHLTRKTCICRQLEKSLNTFVQERHQGSFIINEDHLKRITDSLYSDIFFWVAHGCNKDVKDIFRKIETDLLHLEYLGNTEDRNYELLNNFQNKYWGR